MTRLLAAVAALALAVPAIAQEPPAIKTAKDLDGTYAVKEVNFDGMPAPDDIVKAITGVEIKGGVITVKTAKKDEPAEFTVDAAAKPTAIDLTPKGDKTVLGIVKFEKGARPTDFAAAAGIKKLVLTKKEEKKEPPKEPKEEKKDN